jgi:glycosyltransferase involved in cell wall biosynthesis
MTDRRRRILLHPFFFFAEAWNGIDEHLLLLAKYLDTSRFELLLLVHQTDGPQTRRLAERASIRAIDAPYRPAARARARLGALRALYAAEQVDVVHFHSPVVGGQAIPALAARWAGVPATVATYHQIQPYTLSLKSRAVSRLTHTYLIDEVLAVSSDVRESVSAAAGVPRELASVVHNGIDVPEPGPALEPLPPRANGEVRIGFFGRLSPEKGVPGLLEALARLARRCPAARTYIVGDGPDRSALEAMTSQLGLGDRVTFLGFRPDARQIMQQVDLVVHVPVYEGFGLVVLEAMAAERPVVVNNSPGGLTEIVAHGETGLVVPSGSAEALAQALVYLVEAPQERLRLGRNGRIRREQRFSARGMVEQITASYERVLQHRARQVGRRGPRGLVGAGS